MKGGKLIGQGSYGCVYRPALKCLNQSSREKNNISKLMFFDEARNELKETKVIDKIDPDNKFHLPSPTICTPAIPDLDNDNLLKGCDLMGKIHQEMKEEEITEILEPYRILNYKDGGLSLRDYINYLVDNKMLENKEMEEQRFLNFFFSCKNIFEGLVKLKNNNYCHFDIKSDNIVIDPKTLKLNLIDFGLSDSFKNIKESNKIHSGYFVWPMDVLFLDDKILSLLKNEEYGKLKNGIMDTYSFSYSRIFFENKFGFNDNNLVENIYTDIAKSTNLFKYNTELELFGKKGKFKYNIVSKIDIFSFGVVLVDMWTKIFNSKFTNTKKLPFLPDNNSKNKEFLNMIHTLIMSMINPINNERFSPEQALDYFLSIENLFNKSKQFKKPQSITKKQMEQPPKLEDIPKTLKSNKVIFKLKGKSKTKKVCPQGKVLNPKTNRCINKKGKLALDLKKKGIIESSVKSTQKSKIMKKNPKKLKLVKSIKKTKKICPEGKILNPKTNRCINKKGQLAKKLKLI